jgi:hypothetical protein
MKKEKRGEIEHKHKQRIASTEIRAGKRMSQKEYHNNHN